MDQPHHLISNAPEPDRSSFPPTQSERQVHWAVSYSEQYGPAGHLAHKLDTLMSRRIDEAGRPLPAVVKLGSLQDIAEELALGGDTDALQQAFWQHTGMRISAQSKPQSADQSENARDADFTRYTVVFPRELLPSGTAADAVYLLLSTTYRELL